MSSSTSSTTRFGLFFPRVQFAKGAKLAQDAAKALNDYNKCILPIIDEGSHNLPGQESPTAKCRPELERRSKTADALNTWLTPSNKWDYFKYLVQYRKTPPRNLFRNKRSLPLEMNSYLHVCASTIHHSSDSPPVWRMWHPYRDSFDISIQKDHGFSSHLFEYPTPFIQSSIFQNDEELKCFSAFTTLVDSRTISKINSSYKGRDDSKSKYTDAIQPLLTLTKCGVDPSGFLPDLPLYIPHLANPRDSTDPASVAWWDSK